MTHRLDREPLWRVTFTKPARSYTLRAATKADAFRTASEQESIVGRSRTLKSSVIEALIHDLQDETGLHAVLAAEYVLEETETALGREIPGSSEIAEELAAKAEETYLHSTTFRKSLRGAKGRDQLYVWYRHWLASVLGKRTPGLLERLDVSFRTGHPARLRRR